MGSYIARRTVSLLVVVLVVASIAFTLIRLVPGDPASAMLGPDATAQDVERLRSELQLDQPLPVQFMAWVGQVTRGNFGFSYFTGQPVMEVVFERLQPSVALAIMALVVAIGIGIPAGVVAAVKRGTMLDQLVLTTAFLGASVPTFWLAMMLILLFSIQLGWLPAAGYRPLVDGLGQGLSYLVLPAITLGFHNSALITRMTRSSMLEILGQDYVRTATAKGLPRWQVLLVHAFRNALVPVITVVGLVLAGLIGQAVVTETVFAIPGVGRLVVSSVLRRDYAVLQGILMLVAAVYVIVNLLVDLAYLVIDPRIRY